MMKCVFALVLLLHFCYSADNSVNFNLHTEMIERLGKLNKLYKGKQLKITSPDAVRMPSRDMHNNADSCVNVFIQELSLLLSNVTVQQENENILTELKGNLQHMKPRLQQTDHQCKMEQNIRSLTPFKPYSAFLKKLNGRKR